MTYTTYPELMRSKHWWNVTGMESARTRKLAEEIHRQLQGLERKYEMLKGPVGFPEIRAGDIDELSPQIPPERIFAGEFRKVIGKLPAPYVDVIEKCSPEESGRWVEHFEKESQRLGMSKKKVVVRCIEDLFRGDQFALWLDGVVVRIEACFEAVETALSGS